MRFFDVLIAHACPYVGRARATIYYGLGHCKLLPYRLLMRPRLNGTTLG